MLKLIIGVKGTGKTKTLINLVNGALEVTKGDVVCIEKGVKLRYDIKPTARLVDTEEYMISDAQALYGFVAGVLASNHDVTDLFVDGTLKICKQDIAAFEVLVSNIVNGLYNDGKVDAVSIAKYSQFAEREYFGKPCGLLDQMASSVGGFTYADFNDPANPIIEKIDLDITKSGHTLCVVDTGGNHADLTQDYADITIECKKISNALGVDFLRDADEIEFQSKMGELRATCGDRAVLRAFHFFNENQRVGLQRAALKKGDFEEFFEYVNDSGESSYKYLQNLYSNSNVEEQGLSLAIAVTKNFLGKSGACRVHGGGFAGTIQCYIPNDRLDAYCTMIEAIDGENSCVPLKIRPVGGYELV